MKRKDVSGRILDWTPEQGRLRLQMLPTSYLRSERVANQMFLQAIRARESDDGG